MIRLVQAHSAMRRVATRRKNNALSFPTKIKFHKSLVLSLQLSGCESWTSKVDLEWRIETFENKRYRRMLSISYRENTTNENVWEQVGILAAQRRLLQSTAKRRKLSGFSHVYRHDMLPNSYFKEQWMVVVAEEDFISHVRTTAGNGQASR